MAKFDTTPLGLCHSWIRLSKLDLKILETTTRTCERS
jgi:hypothetical protein